MSKEVRLMTGGKGDTERYWSPFSSEFRGNNTIVIRNERDGVDMVEGRTQMRCHFPISKAKLKSSARREMQRGKRRVIQGR